MQHGFSFCTTFASHWRMQLLRADTRPHPPGRAPGSSWESAWERIVLHVAPFAFTRERSEPHQAVVALYLTRAASRALVTEIAKTVTSTRTSRSSANRHSISVSR